MYHLGLWRLSISHVARSCRKKIVTYLWAEEHADQERQSGEKGRAELQSPGNLASVFYNQVGDGSKEDAKGSPQLPCHDKSSTNGSRGVLSRKDRYCGALASHTDTKKETSNEELLPCLRDS